MAARRTTFGKTQREREKRAKQVAKREKKQAMSEVEPEEETTSATTAPVDQEAVISQLEKLHERYADGGMSLDDFEAAREELLARLTV